MANSVIVPPCMARFSMSPRWLCLISLVLIHTVTAVQLAPISHSPHIQDASSVLKRQESFTGELDLQDFETFYWGAPAGTNLIYANLTVYFPEQYERVIAMERFADQLKSVQCAEDMMLEFKDDASFEYAKDVWNWVNDDVNRTFIMVTNYEGCADDMERLPFVVSNIRYDEAANKAFLKADLKEWEEVAHTYTLNIGHTPITPVHRMLMSRNLLPRDSDFSMNLVSGFDKNLFSATVGGWTTSVDAVVRTVGSLDVDFDIDVGLLKLKSASMTITPENVAASIQLALTERGKLGKAYTWQDTIISIPMNGIEITKVVKLGAFLDVDVGFTMSEWEGTATASLGARMELSNSAIVKIDLVNSKNNQFSGWTPKFSSIPLTLNAKVEGSARVFAEPNVKIEASALGKGWNVGLNLQMPYIEADFAAMLDTTGVCNTKKTLGVDVDARVGVELSVQAATKGNEGNPFWSQELFSSEWDLFSKCLSFGPDNAKPGEIAEPKPPKSKSKKSKSKPPKPSKTPKPKPKSSKPAVTLKPTPRPKKPAPTSARPSKAVTTKTAKPTDAGKASSKASPKPTPDASKRSSKSPKPTSDDDRPSSKPKPSTSTGSDDKRISSSKNPSSASESNSSRSISTSVPFRNSSIAVSGITKPPSTLTTATLSVSSSVSSSAPESCPLDRRGCNTCGVLADPGGLDAEYFSQQIPDSSEVEERSLRRRFDTRRYTFNCGNGNKTIRMARYPQYADLKLPQITVSNFYRAESSTDCLNHQITPITATNTAILGSGKLQYEMEHIYEGVWILRFLEHLSKVEKIPCADMEAMFFTKWGPSSKNPAFITRLMESLGSRKNQDDLVFLWKDINGAKHRLFDLDNDIIAETGSTGFRNIHATLKVDRIATVGRAMEYMARPDIGARLLSTAKRVESELAALTNALPSILSSASLANLKTLKDPGVLVYKHRKWLNGFLHDRNHNAITSMRRWASVASTEFVKTTPAVTDTAKASEWTKTTKFLEALQTAPPVGFKWRQYAPLLPEP